MSAQDQIIKQLADSMRKPPKTSPYDTAAKVVRIEDGVAWVHIDGGADETPVSMTINAKEGDDVQVRVGGGGAWLTGNRTAPPTDDNTAINARNIANKAQYTAETALQDAENARNAAEAAQQSADIAAGAASRAQSSADAAATAASNAQDSADDAMTAAQDAQDSADDAATAASNAQTSADNAQASADSAGEYAVRALGNLSTVQSVVETLNWITQHGTMTLTTDTAIDPTHVYFVQDASGDYVVGGTHYSLVREPVAADLSTYYVLSIDESLQNYVGTHLAVTDEGLWVLPAATGYKVLIATGNGTTYTTAGTYIIDAAGATVARFSEEVQIGADGESHLFMDYHSIQFVDRDGDTFFHVSDLRDRDGNITEYFEGDGTTTEFTLKASAINTTYVVMVDGVEQTNDITKELSKFTFVTAPNDGAVIKVIYRPAWSSVARMMKAYTLGIGKPDTSFGQYSMREGYYTAAAGKYAHAEGSFSSAEGEAAHSEGFNTEASGQDSHAEGLYSKASSWGAHAEGGKSTASGVCSHAEGGGSIRNGVPAYVNTASGEGSHAEGAATTASGMYSHAQGLGTIAASMAQCAMGKYNVSDASDNYAVVIGNGTSDSARSNALTLGWNGVLTTADGFSTSAAMIRVTDCNNATDPRKIYYTNGDASNLNRPEAGWCVIRSLYLNGDPSAGNAWTCMQIGMPMNTSTPRLFVRSKGLNVAWSAWKTITLA